MAALRDKEGRELTHLRAWLLPLLMNGQVRVDMNVSCCTAKLLRRPR